MSKKTIGKEMWCVKCTEKTPHISVYSGELQRIQTSYCLNCHPNKDRLNIIMKVLIDDLEEKEE